MGNFDFSFVLQIAQGARLNPEQQGSSVIQGTAVYESGLSSSHDQSQHYYRNYIPVNLLEPNQDSPVKTNLLFNLFKLNYDFCKTCFPLQNVSQRDRD